MLFNSFIFLFGFLPPIFLLFIVCRRYFNNQSAIGVLVAASFLFYSYWNPDHLIILALSTIANFLVGQKLAEPGSQAKRKTLLTIAVASNLLLLGYYKYTNFLIDNVNELTHWSLSPQDIILPLAISFFTFQQIAYLADSYRHEATERNFLNYCLFISFFPQLIAGPIVHHKEMMPQFSNLPALSETVKNAGLGLALFSLGLFKKVVIADNFAPYANHVFNSATTSDIATGDAWIGAISYHFQIYFDFSGYSDMAIGLACIFGIMLPINFDSPYKSTSIIDFWRSWHMTLSRFLKDYLYITLGGNRKGKLRRHINLITTMLLGGLWHGAAWTFVVWGGLHGLYLVLNHGWRNLLDRAQLRSVRYHWLYRVIGLSLTTLGVLIAWVYFRASDLHSANQILLAMFGISESGISQSLANTLQQQGFASILTHLSYTPLPSWSIAIGIIVLTQLLVIYTPNSMQILQSWKDNKSLPMAINWEVCCGLLLGMSIIGMFGFSEFIYFQF